MIGTRIGRTKGLSGLSAKYPMASWMRAGEDLQRSVGSEDKHTYTKCSGGLRDARLRLARKVEMREWTAQRSAPGR